MGKKKASKSRVLKPILEEAIRDGRIFCRHRANNRIVLDIDGDLQIECDRRDPNYEIYEVSFGSDVQWWVIHSLSQPHIPVEVHVFDDGNIDYHFVFPQTHMLAREYEVWFKRELEEIITMHRLGAYESELQAQSANGRAETGQYIRNATKAGIRPRRLRNGLIK